MDKCAPSSPPSFTYLTVVRVSAAVEELVLDAAEALDCQTPPALPPALLARRQRLHLHAEELGSASDEKPVKKRGMNLRMIIGYE